jgi:ATP-dependent DNA helicase RecQ
MKFKAGFIIDEIFDLYKLKNTESDFESLITKFSAHTYFIIHGFDESYSITENNINNILFSTIHNIITRGTPSRASLKVCEELLKKYKYKKTVSTTGDIKYINNETEIDSLSRIDELFPLKAKGTIINELIYKPIAIGQIQYLIIHLFIIGKIKIEEQWVIHSSEGSKKIIKLALEDLFELISSIEQLNNRKFKCPKITFVTDKLISRTLSLGLVQFGDIPTDYHFAIEYFKYQRKDKSDSTEIINNETDEILKKEVISEYDNDYISKIQTYNKNKYKRIGNYDLSGNLAYDDNNLKAIRYLLQNLFRKEDFRDGQLPIINRVLQGMDVIGILPTGSGKSLTYQLCAILQPGITLVIDPIRSLMVDQYEKLRSNFIDKVIFINSNDTKEERQAKEKLIATGYVQIAIIGPERFQIQEFRDYLSEVKARNLHFAYTVIDEAHCISEWGHDFRFSYLRLSENILKICFNNEKNIFTQIALTATASFDVIADIQRELRMDNESFLPIPSINRDELNFDVCDVGEYTLSQEEKESINIKKTKKHSEYIIDSEFFLREKGLALKKYPILKENLKVIIPEKLKTIGANSYKKAPFWTHDEYGYYPNAGLIFCPTKSDALGNGVYAISNNMLNQRTGEIQLAGLSTESDYLELGTFMGGGDENSWENKRVNSLAEKSMQNQKLFLNNKLNLMVATKAFGMGIDKSNIRFTIHYSIPQSIESFYQEAGRAGRDRIDSYNLILYSKTDVNNNLDFIKNSHKGARRELQIFEELLTTIRYEDNFFIKYISNLTTNKFKQVKSLNLSQNDKGKWYIYVNGKWNEEIKKSDSLGKIYLGDRGVVLIPYTDNVVCKTEQAEEILQYILAYIKDNCPSRNYLEWLHSKEADGIETILNRCTPLQKPKLIIGLDNDTIEDLGAKIGDIRNEENMVVSSGKRIIKAAYNFCDGDTDEKIENRFISNLVYQYWRDSERQTPFKYSDEFLETVVSDELEFKKYFVESIEYYKNSFWQIRNVLDTQKAIYRLSILGVIDDYTIDYATNTAILYFSAKTEETYLKNYQNYLSKYIGEESVKLRIEKAQLIQNTTDLRKYLFELIYFFEETLTSKRLAAASYMNHIIENVFLKNKQNGERDFKEEMEFYFKSKYARQEHFVKDFAKNVEHIELFSKYLQYIKNPPDGLGKEYDNLQHIKGACARYILTNEDNCIVSLLNAYSTLALEAKALHNSEIVKQKCRNEMNATYKAFKKLLNKNINKKNIVELLNLFTSELGKLNPQVLNSINDLLKMKIEPLINNYYLNHTHL